MDIKSKCNLCGIDIIKKSWHVKPNALLFCSRKCSCQYATNKRWEQHQVPKQNCKSCGVKIFPHNKFCRSCYYKSDLVKRKHDDETKKLLSEKRKSFLKMNPDKHVWKRHNKFKSKACESVKNWLKEKQIEFEEEYSEHGVPNRFFSIDIAFPEKKLAVEVNGNQHYNRDGSLKEYYSKRTFLLEKEGWKVFQLHYSICFNVSKIELFFNQLLNGTRGGS